MLKLQRKLKNKKFIKVLSVWVVVAFFSILFAPFLSVANADSREERARKIEEALNAQATSTQDRTPVPESTPEPVLESTNAGTPSLEGGDGEPEAVGNGGGEETGASNGAPVVGGGEPSVGDGEQPSVSSANQGDSSKNNQPAGGNASGIGTMNEGGEKNQNIEVLFTDEELEKIRNTSSEERNARLNELGGIENSMSKVRFSLRAECEEKLKGEGVDKGLGAAIKECVDNGAKEYLILKKYEMAITEEDETLKNIHLAQFALDNNDEKALENLTIMTSEGEKSISDLGENPALALKQAENVRIAELKKTGGDMTEEHSLFKDFMNGTIGKLVDGQFSEILSNNGEWLAGGAILTSAICVKKPALCHRILGADFSPAKGFGKDGLKDLTKQEYKAVMRSARNSGLGKSGAIETAQSAAERTYAKGYRGSLDTNGNFHIGSNSKQFLSELTETERRVAPAINVYLNKIGETALTGWTYYENASMAGKALLWLYGASATVGAAFGLTGVAGLAAGGAIVGGSVAAVGYGVYNVANDIYMNLKYPDEFKSKYTNDYLDGGIDADENDSLEDVMHKGVEKYGGEDTLVDTGASWDEPNFVSDSQSEAYKNTGIDIYNDVVD